MATTKTFKTLFQIAAKYTGKPALEQANRALAQTQRNAQKVHVSFGSMFRGIAGSAIALSVAASSW
jgi:hypothetical protein